MRYQEWRFFITSRLEEDQEVIDGAYCQTEQEHERALADRKKKEGGGWR